MQNLLERYEQLPESIQSHSIYGSKKIKESLSDPPTEKQLEKLKKKIELGEKTWEKAKEQGEILERKRAIFEEITSHPQFKPETLTGKFKISYDSCKKKLKELETGLPTDSKVKLVNVEHLKEKWIEMLPKPIMVDSTGFDTYIIKAKKTIEANMPIFQAKPGATDKVLEWQALERTLREKLEGGEEKVDVRPMEDIRDFLGSLLPKALVKSLAAPKTPKTSKTSKCIGRCKGSEKAVNGDYCLDCSIDYWDDVYSNMKTRARQYKKTASTEDFNHYDQISLIEFQDAYAAFEDSDGKKGYKKLVELYKPIDKLLPAMGTFKVNPLMTVDSDSSLLSDDEEEEEEEYSSSSDEEEVVKKKRSRSSLGDVLTIFSGANPDILELHEIFKKEGDSEEFEQALKKIKENVVQHTVSIYHKETGVDFPFVPDPVTFYSEEAAIARGKELVKLTPTGGGYHFKVSATK